MKCNDLQHFHVVRLITHYKINNKIKRHDKASPKTKYLPLLLRIHIN